MGCEIRELAVKKIHNQDILKKVALTEKLYRLRIAAIENLEDENVLELHFAMMQEERKREHIQQKRAEQKRASLRKK